MKYWAFAFYSIFYEAIVWCIFGYAVFFLHESAWWFLLATLLSCGQWKPAHFDMLSGAHE